jgi:ferrochelatase
MSQDDRKIGVLVINFGEPDEPTLEKVEPFLEQIFLQNTDLEGHVSEEAVARARMLAKRRAPGLIEEYESIGGSPLNGQSDEQAEALAQELERRGGKVTVYSAFQFTRPSIEEKVAEAREDGVDVIVALPIYPICGKSTTVEALRSTERSMRSLGWDRELVSVSGWHHHPDYRKLRADNIARFARERGLDLTASDTILYFSVHGTPVKYLDEGNRYDRYVEEQCRDVAERLGTDRWAVGFQNHTNRGIPWTQPDNEALMESLDETRLVVVPISFMHEQSETLSELDHELKAFAEGLGKEFHRVPVPWDGDAFPALLADLVEDAVAAADGRETTLARCRCSDVDGTWCTNGARDLPPSPYVPAGA